MGDANMKEKKCAKDMIYVSVLKTPLSYKPIDVCGLNDDCIRHVCEYLDLPDLYNMCVASDELKIKIVENAIRGRMIAFNELADCCHIVHIFKIFGCNMTKIEIGEKDIQYKAKKFSKLDEILRLVSTYCRKDTLKHLTLQYFEGSAIRKRFLYSSLPLFRCIESLSIKETVSNGVDKCINYFSSYPTFNTSVNDFLERLVANAPNINSLRLLNMKITGRLFYLDHISKLKTLSLNGCNVRVSNAFLTFLREKQHLTSLTWENSSLFGLDTHNSHSSNTVYKLATSRINHLEAFSYYPNEGFINDENRYDTEFNFKQPDYQRLSKFGNLKELSVPGISLACLRLLAEQNTVEKLFTSFSRVSSRDTVQDLSFLYNFTSLRSIQVFIPLGEQTRMFNKLLLSKLLRLTQCFIDFIIIDKEMLEVVVETARNLRALHISFRRGNFSVALYTKLVGIRLRQESVTHPLVIFLENKLIAQLLSRKTKFYRPDIIAVRVRN
ncbi:hypothetical protein Bhyg_01616 [Pseudolycoriella hygida]|uniref:F-box domain-containing protein n=1 Tax=Pseudolycoriella hygida TaxID=35572 RepID=A0A9Q0S7R4_9DIPT|nr:hypothetical protein Bhyg_01616 [Pseudolycoriella hygida]